MSQITTFAIFADRTRVTAQSPKLCPGNPIAGMDVLRKLFCIPPRECKEANLSPYAELLASAAEDCGWIDTTLYPPLQSAVPPSQDRKRELKSRDGLLEYVLCEVKCRGCKGVTEVVQRGRGGEVVKVADCSVLFIQKKSKKVPSVPFQKGIEYPIKKYSDELKDLGFEKEMKSGDRVDARYSKCIKVVNCSFCGKYDRKYFLSALCQKNEKVGGVKLHFVHIQAKKGHRAKSSPEGTTWTKAGKDLDAWIGTTV